MNARGKSFRERTFPSLSVLSYIPWERGPIREEFEARMLGSQSLIRHLRCGGY